MRKQLLWSAMLASAMLVGCEDKDNTTTTPPTPPKTPPAPQVDMNKAADSMNKAADSNKDAAKSATDAPKSAADTAPAKDAAAATPPAAGDAAAMTEADAQAKLDKAIAYIKDKKYDLADSTLKELETHKASLPASIPPKVDEARKMLDAAKAAGGMSMPGMTK